MRDHRCQSGMHTRGRCVPAADNILKETHHKWNVKHCMIRGALPKLQVLCMKNTKLGLKINDLRWRFPQSGIVRVVKS